ncbi:MULTISPECIES: nicotinate-nucleotide adenylyltransferase [Clostridium]|uniref:Probable nicotinate-nucleotide adenylyltransferase n=1 Tax=Clostridium cibarium TaxID=2762247 RepID=A0ABR8PR22_9CLOT|nr:MULTISPECIES: nicotinate-nucleotide adenylyltransferase [Clostridium]MBD7910623.1 nicotinate-nucleotide adenylyltransferase [Clostridium cibarium]
MNKVGIIGGSFDPIHFAHLYIAEEAKKRLDLDKVIFIPVGSQPLKQDKKVTEASLRFNMVQLAIKRKVGFTVSDYEIKKKGLSYTYETLEHFKNDGDELYFITGADCLFSLDKWKGVQRIFELCKFAVFTRPGYSDNELIKRKSFIENKYNGKIILLELEGLNISSTEIRKKIFKGESVKNLVPKSVLDIIKEKGLYREE